MSSTNKTRILKLNQWLSTDRVKRMDFNEDNTKLENIIKGLYKTINFNNNRLELTKVDDTVQNLNILSNATDTTGGIISKNSIKDIVKEYGIGGNINTKNINSKLVSGLYFSDNSSKINNKETVALNINKDNNSFQLLSTIETTPKIYIRTMTNNSLNNKLEVHTSETLKPASIESIWRGVANE